MISQVLQKGLNISKQHKNLTKTQQKQWFTLLNLNYLESPLIPCFLWFKRCLICLQCYRYDFWRYRWLIKPRIKRINETQIYSQQNFDKFSNLNVYFESQFSTLEKNSHKVAEKYILPIWVWEKNHLFQSKKMNFNLNTKSLLSVSSTLIKSLRNASKKTGGSTKNPADPHGR